MPFTWYEVAGMLSLVCYCMFYVVDSHSYSLDSLVLVLYRFGIGSIEVCVGDIQLLIVRQNCIAE